MEMVVGIMIGRERKGKRRNDWMMRNGWYFSDNERIAHTLELGVGTVCRFFFCV